MRRQEKWQALLAPVIEDTPYELVGVESIGGGKHTVIRVYLDKPGGITIDDIAHVSHAISAVLDVQDIFKGAYTLEVSSPGLDRPLFSPIHFQQQIGQKISLKTQVPYENRHNFKGMLTKANDEGVELEVDGVIYSFQYTNIDKARVIPQLKQGKAK